MMLRTTLVLAAVAYAGICLYMYVQQRSLQYFPGRQGLRPEAVGLGGVHEVWLATPDGERIAAWHGPAPDGQPTILFLHGNGGEIGDRADRMRFYLSEGFGALFVSYRGYGASSGSISEQGLVTDAVTAHDWLVAQGVDPRRIVVVGESLGTGVAVQLAARRPVAAVALEAPFASAADIAASIYWWLPVSLLMKDTFHSRDHIARVTAPLLVQHGDADTIIPVAQGKALFDLANEPKELVILPGAGHGVIMEKAVWEREVAFFRSVLGLQ